MRNVVAKTLRGEKGPTVYAEGRPPQYAPHTSEDGVVSYVKVARGVPITMGRCARSLYKAKKASYLWSYRHG